MTNRRKFIKQVATAGVVASIPSVLFPQQNSTQHIRLLVRADDMGITYDKTLAIIKTHKEGIVTSASIMPTSPFFEESAQLCKANPTLVVGIHITLLGTKIRPALSPEIVPSILAPSGFFYETQDQLNNANPKVEEMEKEIRAQIEKVRASGLHFVYLDCHRGGTEKANAIIIKLCHEQQLIFGRDYDGSMYGYKLLQLMPENWPTQQMSDGQIITLAAPAFNNEQQQLFFDRLTNLEPGQWQSFMHPGLAEPQRTSVMELLCSPKTKEILKMKNIQLVSYYDLWKEEFGKTKSR